MHLKKNFTSDFGKIFVEISLPSIQTFLNFLANPKNRGVLNFISGVIEKSFAILDDGIGKLIAGLLILGPALTGLASALGLTNFGQGLAGGAGGFFGAGVRGAPTWWVQPWVQEN